MRRVRDALTDLRRRGGADALAGLVLVAAGVLAIVAAVVVALL